MYILECCSILIGTAFHLSWNIIPDDMEQDSILAVTKRVTKKRCLNPKTALFGSIAFKACYPLSPHAKEERGVRPLLHTLCF